MVSTGPKNDSGPSCRHPVTLVFLNSPFFPLTWNREDRSLFAKVYLPGKPLKSGERNSKLWMLHLQTLLLLPSSPTLLLFQFLIPSFVLPVGLSTGGSLRREPESLAIIWLSPSSQLNFNLTPTMRRVQLIYPHLLSVLFLSTSYLCSGLWSACQLKMCKIIWRMRAKVFFSIHSRCPRSNSSSFS